MCVFLAMWVRQPKGSWGGLLLFANIAQRGIWDSSNPGCVALGNPRGCSPEGMHSAASWSLFDHSQTNFLWCVYLREIVLGATSIWHLAVWKSSQPSGSAVLQQPSRLAEGPANPTCLCLTNQNFANTSETFQYWQKASACEDAVPHARSMCVLWQSLLKLLWTRVPQKCQAGAGLLTRTAVGGGAQGLLLRR